MPSGLIDQMARSPGRAPEDIGSAVAVEIRGGGDMPIGSDLAEHKGRNDSSVAGLVAEAGIRQSNELGATRLPDRELSGWRAPQDVVASVEIEIALCGDLPGVVDAVEHRVGFSWTLL